MIAYSRGVQIFQGIISVILGGVSVLLSILLRHSGYSIYTLLTFFIVGITLVFSGDYLINLFRLPVNEKKQQLFSEVCLISYGVFYVNIGLSHLLQPILLYNLSHKISPLWVRRGITSIGIILIIGGVYDIIKLYSQSKTETV
ncbi:hypothetical protein JT359_17120 [Candidatus Poribacteria bacterium]|nr:hypothetical protein [Candidatus Poribacteria bacterium]